MPPKLNIDITSIAENPDITQGGTVHIGSVVVSATGVTSNGLTQCMNPQDLSFTEAGCLGRGSSGSVRRVKRKDTGEYIALKEIKVTSQSHLHEIERELKTLHSAQIPPSPFLVDFHGAYSHDGSVFIAMECMDGSLADIRPVDSIEMLARITRNVLSGLVYLHKMRFLVHRDLKPGNILYSLKGIVKISDFGVSTTLECSKDNTQSFVGTVTYMSPERLQGDKYSFAADVWSLGIVVAELQLGNHPFADILPEGQGSEGRFWALLQHLSGNAPSVILPPDTNPLLADFVECCLRKDPQQRSTSEALLQHMFITTFAPGSDEENKEGLRQWLKVKAGNASPAPTEEKKLNLDDALGRLALMAGNTSKKH